MASGTFYLEDAYNSKSPNCVDAYVSWSSVLNSGNSHTVTMKLYARRKDYTGATNIQYSAPSGSGWSRTYTNSYLVFSGGSYVHICTVETTVTSTSAGVASFSGATFYAGFYSSSYGTRRMSGTITSLQLDQPKMSVSISAPSGISCTSSSYSPTVNSQITLTVTITNTTKYASYSISVTGATLVSGTTYRVTGNVTVVVTGTLKQYTLSITASKGITVRAVSGSTSYANGSKITYGTQLVISVSVGNGYDFLSFTVNGTDYNEGSQVSVTVSSNITVVANAREAGVVYIRDNTGTNRYQVYIYTASGWSLHKPMLYTSSGWGVCS
ncbi:MAG: hypothetical protein Q4E91_12655 [Lachnospiraceae bacterium]|nr:hypothetical protein [Lachnospiraceae bacterium]